MQPILPSLTGITLVGTPGGLKPGGIPGHGIDTGGIALLKGADFTDQLTPYLGKPVSLHDLNEIARIIVLYYRSRGHPLVDVTVPQQDVTSGAVQFLVSEFKAGKVEVEGNHWFSSGQMLEGLHVTPGEPVDGDRLLGDVAWLNQNPFRHVDLVYRRATDPQTTDIVLQTTDRFPVRVYAGYDNSGTRITGRDRVNLGFNWGNALWSGQLFSYQFSSSDDFWHNRAETATRPDAPTFVSHSFDWQIPLPWHHRLDIFGLYEKINPRIGPDFAAPGTSGQASLRYVIPWQRSERISGDWQLGYDFKTTNNNLEFGGTQVSNTASNIHQFVLGADVTILDGLGSTALALTAFLSPGGLGRGNDNKDFAASSPLGTAQYAYTQFALSRLTRLPFDLTWATRLKAQISNANLLPSERLGFGGTDYGRGYDPFSASGDDGVLFSNELRLPPWHVAPKGAELQLFTFWDYGSVYYHRTPLDPATLKPASHGTELASTGFGLHYIYDRYIEFRLDCGFQLRTLPGAGGRGQFANVSITISY